MPEGVRIGFLPLQHPGCRGAQAYPAALLAGSRPHIDYPVGGVHGLGVVLDHHHGIAFVTEFLERGYEFPVVPLVQAYARLVEYVEHVHEFGTYLGGESDALALSS